MNERMQGITLETDSGRLLLINVYFPTDPKTKNYRLDDEVEDLLATIENAIKVNHCESVVIIEDINMDFARGKCRVAIIEQFLSRNSIVAAWKRYPVDYTHEFEMDDVTYPSTIDHVMWNEELSSQISDAGVTHIVANTSDHCPIFCDLKLSVSSKDEKRKDTSKKTGISTKSLNEDDWEWFNACAQNNSRRYQSQNA